MTVGLIVFGAGSVVGASATASSPHRRPSHPGPRSRVRAPATLSIVTNTFDRDERGKAIAIWTAVGGMGIGLGPAVGGYLVDRWDWAAAFWIHVPDHRRGTRRPVVVARAATTPRRPRRPGAITATLGISTLVFGIIQGTEEGWTSPLILASFAPRRAARGLRGDREPGRAPDAAAAILPQPDFTGSVLVIGIMFFAGPATFFFLTQFFQIVQGRDPFEAGLLILPNAGAIVAASAIAPRLGRAIGPRRVVMISVAIMTVATALFTGVDAGWEALTAIALITLFGFGFGLGMPALTDAVMASVPIEDAGVGSAVNDVSRELGSALGVAVIGSFISSLYRSNVED